MTVLSEQDKIRLLANIVKIQTENDHEIEVCEYLKDLLSQYDIDSKIVKVNDSRANLVAEIGSGAPVLAISGHMDVVDAGDHDDWTFPPFELTDKDGKLFGRGTTDMKGGLMAMVIAMIELKQSNALKQGTIRLLATTGEETEQYGAQLLADEGYLDDVSGLIIGEPTSNIAYYAHKGSMSCVVTAKGKAAHSSMPHLGTNAVDILVDFVNEMKQEYKNIKEHDKVHELDAVPMIEKHLHRKIGEEESHIYSGFVMLNSVFNGGKQVNSVPHKATAKYNVRTVPEYDSTFVKDLFEKVIRHVGEDYLTVDIPSSHDPVASDRDNPLIQNITRIAPNYVHEDIVVSALIGTTDASSFLGTNENNVDFAVFGPGESIMAHQVDEFIRKDMYLSYIDVYKDVFKAYLEK